MVNSQPLWKLAGCALLLGACAPALQEQGSAFAPAPPAEASTVVVRNDYFGELDLYVVAGATRTRLGSIRTAETGKFRIPGAFLIRPEIQFQVDPVGPVAPFTYQPVALRAGNDIELAVAPSLGMSSYAIVVNH